MWRSRSFRSTSALKLNATGMPTWCSAAMVAAMSAGFLIALMRPSTTDSQITVRGHIASQRRNIVTIHLTLENSKGEVCDEGEAIYFTFGPDKAKEMGFDSCKVEGEE